MLKKVRRRVKILINKNLKKQQQHNKPSPANIEPSPATSSSPETPPPPENMATHKKPSFPFQFPAVDSTVVPDPSHFFSQSLLSTPLPTNSFFQNFVLKNGDQPEYIHPYLIKSSNSSLSISYPTLTSNSGFLYQNFVPDFTISAVSNTDHHHHSDSNRAHVVSSFTDLGVTLDLPSANLRFYLVRGSPYVTFSVSGTAVSISTVHAILNLSANTSLTKYTAVLNNGQTWFIYSSSPVSLTLDGISLITSSGGVFSGIIRIAVVPNVDDPRYGDILDRCSSCYPVSGNAVFTKPFCMEYVWEKRGWGDLLMLAHPLHLRMLSNETCGVSVLGDFKYKSIDGDLVGVVGDSWVMKPDPVSVTWHSIRGIKEEAYPEILTALHSDVTELNSSAEITSSSYFYGKLVARAARLALIAEEVCCLEAIQAIRCYLKDRLEPWLNGTFGGNGFLYDGKWGGIVTRQGSSDSGADFGFGIYNDHHYHLGYFLYAIAVLAKIDPAWGRKYRPQAYALVADFMNMGRGSNSHYPRLRCFDLWKLHSWAGGLTEFADGRNQESTSEAINAYYSAALMGLAYGDTHLVATGSILTAMEIQSAQTWWHVRHGDTMYGVDFTKENRMVSVLWSNKRDSGLWFAPPDWKECRLGIQVLPLLPITEIMFSDVGFVRDLVNWTLPALAREGVGEGWKGFVYALEGIYDKQGALEKTRKLNGFDDGNSLTNLLWWIHSRSNDEEEHCHGGGGYCWFGHYCH